MQSLISKSLLEEYYINQNKSSIEIAKELNVSSSWIQKLIREYKNILVLVNIMVMSI